MVSKNRKEKYIFTQKNSVYLTLIVYTIFCKVPYINIHLILMHLYADKTVNDKNDLIIFNLI